MSGRDGVQSLLVLRKLTRAITDAVRVQMTGYLKVLTPLLQPKVVLGEYVQGGQREPNRKADKAFADLQVDPQRVHEVASLIPGAMRGLVSERQLGSYADQDEARRGLTNAIVAYLSDSGVAGKARASAESTQAFRGR